jgi:hypothetical protein
MRHKFSSLKNGIAVTGVMRPARVAIKISSRCFRKESEVVAFNAGPIRVEAPRALVKRINVGISMWCGRTNAVEIWLIIWVILEVSGIRRVMPSMMGGKYDVVSSTDGVRKWDKAKVWIKLRVVRQLFVTDS